MVSPNEEKGILAFLDEAAKSNEPAVLVRAQEYVALFRKLYSAHDAATDGDKMVFEWLAETHREDSSMLQSAAAALTSPRPFLNPGEENPFETDNFAMCEELLDFFLWDCPATFIQPHSTIREWREIFVRRGPEFAPLVAEVDDFFSPVIKPSQL